MLFSEKTNSNIILSKKVNYQSFGKPQRIKNFSFLDLREAWKIFQDFTAHEARRKLKISNLPGDHRLKNYISETPESGFLHIWFALLRRFL